MINQVLNVRKKLKLQEEKTLRIVEKNKEVKGMSLKEKLQEDLKSSMKNKDTVKKSVVTLIRASIKQYEVDNRVELEDDAIIDLIAKQLKQRRDSLVEFEKS